MSNWYTIRALATGAEVIIYDEIGAYGVSAKGFLAELCALPDGTPLTLRLNSPGGSVFDAVAIYNALLRHSGTVTVWIDGIAASAASYVAMAGDEIVMPENAFLMIHDPAGVVMGTAIDMRAMAEALDKIKGSLLQGYSAKSGRPQEEISPLMAAETWLDAKDALDLGFADRIAEPVRIAARFDVGRFRNAPPELAEAVVNAGEEDPSAGAVAPFTDAGDEPATDDEVESAGGEDALGPESLPADPDPPADMEAAPAETHAVSTIAADIRTEALTHARVVVDLCRLAGQPQMAGQFLERDTGIDDVRAALLATRAEAVPDISAAHPQPGRPSGARPWGDVIARTFRLKG
ncbi:MAG: Clp protease ClpP [Burkholderiaceae bacterium]|nr:Clp protease ClpP [Burkholderiaceae bacterium]